MVDIFERRTAIRRQTQTVRDIQAIYMLCVPQLVAAELPSIAVALKKKTEELKRRQWSTAPSATPDVSPATSAPQHTDPAATVPPERMPLFLPLQVPAHLRSGLSANVCAMESQLREGQMRNALGKLRVHLHIRTQLSIFKARQV